MIHIKFPYSEMSTFSKGLGEAADRQAIGGSTKAIFDGIPYIVRTGFPYSYKIVNDTVYQVCDDTLIKKNEVFSIVNAGGNVKNFFLAVEMTLDKFNGEVPVDIPNRLIKEDGQEDVVKTWAQWVGNNTVVTNTNGKKMFHLWGCDAVQAKSLVGVSGYTVLDKAEYKALVPVQEGV